MSEDNFEQMLNETFKTIHTGEVVEGEVIDVKPDQIILNIHSKSDGIITKSEYSNDSSIDLTEVVSVGDIGLFVLNGEGLIKEFHRDGLYSHNKRAKPKKFHEGDAFYVIGRVIRKVTEEDCFTSDELDDVWKLYHEGEINVREVAYDD